MTTTAQQPLPFAPGATLDVSWDWSDWLPAGDTLASYTVTVPAGVTKVSDSRAGAIVTAWVTVPDNTLLFASFALLCEIVTAQGRRDERVFLITATQR